MLGKRFNARKWMWLGVCALILSATVADVSESLAESEAPDLTQMHYSPINAVTIIKAQESEGAEPRILGRIPSPLSFAAEELALEILISGLNSDAEVFIELWDSQGEIIERANAKRFLDVPGWTEIHSVRLVEVFVRGRPQQKPFSVEVRGAALGTNGAQSDGVIEPAGFEPVSALETDIMRNRADPVARLVMESRVTDGVPVNRRCTGFLISGSLLMTNYHCIDKQSVCHSTLALFGFEDDRRKMPEAVWCDELLYATPILDVAVVRLAGQPGNRWGFLSLVGKSFEYRPSLALNAIQHPNGALKRVSRDSACKIIDPTIEGLPARLGFRTLQRYAKDVGVTHGCDTVGGSSGSPLLDENGQVAILHNYSERNRNRGIRIGEIVKCVVIRRKTNSIAQKPGTGPRCMHRPMA